MFHFFLHSIFKARYMLILCAMVCPRASQTPLVSPSRKKVVLRSSHFSHESWKARSGLSTSQGWICDIEFMWRYLFQTWNAPDLNGSRGNYVIATPILHTLAMMAESASNLILPSWLSHTQAPHTPHVPWFSPYFLITKLKKKKKI